MSRNPPPPTSSTAPNKERNEYIPSFISKKPFYISDDLSEADYLEHQRLQKEKEPSPTKWYERGTKLGPASTKYRKGACENCGAMTHKTKDCLSRPRKQGAKWTGKDIQADEKIEKVELGWDAKRDRWNGYDPSEYRNVVQEYEEMEGLRRLARGDDPKALERNEDNVDEGEDVGAEEARYAEESDMGRQQSTATRNLRIREDTAKYLLNLDLDSAKYDPKTRSMVDMGAAPDKSSALVADENFMKASGDAAEFEKAQKYAWESQEKGDQQRQHLQANPTEGEYLRKKQQKEAEEKKLADRKALLTKYGGTEHMQHAPMRNATVMESERYVEYDEHGAIKGAEAILAKSKYPEDVYINNHTSVWGSWWKDFQWGYACCHSTVKNSYCTGEEGRVAFENAEKMRTGEDLLAIEDTRQEQQPPAENHMPSPDASQPKSIEAAPVAKKRTLAELRDGIDADELEAYKKGRFQADDPMASFIGQGEAVH
ncbi:MAG: hypothetical protein Q9160_003822 [Pyrenula sp. 1 TL-2023]